MLLVSLRQLLTAGTIGLVLTLASPMVSADISKGQAAAQAKSQHGGKVLSVEKVGSKDGKATYKVKLLLEGGRVKTVIIRG